MSRDLADQRDGRFADIFGTGRSTGREPQTGRLTAADFHAAYEVQLANGHSVFYADPREGPHCSHLVWVTGRDRTVIYQGTRGAWVADSISQLDGLSRALCPANSFKPEPDGYGPEVQAISSHTGELVRFPAAAEVYKYARICTRDGDELMSWSDEEFAYPADVLGALCGALRNGAEL